MAAGVLGVVSVCSVMAVCDVMSVRVIGRYRQLSVAFFGPLCGSYHPHHFALCLCQGGYVLNIVEVVAMFFNGFFLLRFKVCSVGVVV